MCVNYSINARLPVQSIATFVTPPKPQSDVDVEVPARPKRAASRRNSRRKSSKVPKEAHFNREWSMYTEIHILYIYIYMYKIVDVLG